jgi:uncharacterized protein (DUF433 family)
MPVIRAVWPLQICGICAVAPVRPLFDSSNGEIRDCVFAGILEKGAKIMATLDWSQCTAVESIPGKRSGAWVFKDTRTPVSVVFDNLEAGASISEIMDWFHLSREQIVAVIEFAARSLDAPPPSQQFAQPIDAHTF